MKKFFKRLLFFFLILFVLVIALSILGTSLFGNKIGKRIVEEINKQLTTELKVEKIDLSLIKSFPNISANLHDVLLNGTQGEPLLQAEELSFRLGLLGFLRSKINVNSAILKDGKAYIDIDRNGKGNFEITKPVPETPQEEQAEGPEISLKKTVLKNIDLIYRDQSSKQIIKLWLEEVDFSGEFSKSKFSLASEAALLSQSIQIDGTNYFVGKDAGYNAEIMVDLEQGLYELKDVALHLGENTFNVIGNVQTRENEAYLDLQLENQKGDLASLLQLLPADQLNRLGNLRSSGNFQLNATVKGLVASDRQPAIRAGVALERGRIKASGLGQDFKDVTLAAIFDNGRQQSSASSFFEIEDLTGYFGNNRMQVKLKYENFDDPVIDLFADGILPLQAIYKLMGNPNISDGSGTVALKNIEIAGRLSDLQNPSRIASVKAAGGLQCNRAGLTINKEDMTLESGDLELNSQLLKVSNLKLTGAGSEIAFDGSAFNIIPVLFADSSNSKRAELEFEAELRAKSIDFDRLMALSPASGAAGAVPPEDLDSMKTKQIQKREKITNFLRGNFNAVIEKYNYEKVEGSDFTGKLGFINNEMEISGSTQAMGGVFNLEGQAHFEDEPRLKARLVCENINSRVFFKQTENFGQDFLTAKNIGGNMNAKISISAFWDEAGNFLEDKLHILAGIGITEGELVNFDMLKNFSSFVKIQDLMNINFANLRNFLEYRKQKLYIPVMFIQSNALNLTISGEHSYNNEMEYNIKVNAGQVLANKFKKHDPSLQPLKARKKGFFNLYYTINGTVDDYQIASSKRDVKSDFELSSIRRREIQLALEREFGIVELVEEPVEWRDIPEYDEDADPDDVEFIEWEEEEGDSSAVRGKN